jgi:hypothetical protein
MPRVHINLHDIDEIDELEEQADWEEVIGVDAEQARRDARQAGDSRWRGVRRFGGADSLDRKRADRRKNVVRAAKRI